MPPTTTSATVADIDQQIRDLDTLIGARESQYAELSATDTDDPGFNSLWQKRDFLGDELRRLTRQRQVLDERRQKACEDFSKRPVHAGSYTNRKGKTFVTLTIPLDVAKEVADGKTGAVLGPIRDALLELDGPAPKVERDTNPLTRPRPEKPVDKVGYDHGQRAAAASLGWERRKADLAAFAQASSGELE